MQIVGFLVMPLRITDHSNMTLAVVDCGLTQCFVTSLVRGGIRGGICLFGPGWNPGQDMVLVTNKKDYGFPWVF